MSKIPNQFVISNKADDVEISDEELRAIENMSDGDQDLKDLEMDDLDELENEINAMSGEEHQHTPTSKIEHLSFDLKTEKEFSPIEYFFGNCLEVELEKIIPSIQHKIEKIPAQKEYHAFLKKKEEDLIKYKEAIHAKVAKGDINELKYLEVLQKVHDKNKMIYQKAISEKTSKDIQNRIHDRIELFVKEIQEIKEALGQQTAEAQKTEKSDSNLVPKEQKITKTPELIPISSKQIHEEIKKDVFPPVSTQNIPNPTAQEPLDPAIMHFAHKISVHVSFMSYLEKYFVVEREQDIAVLKTKIDSMKKSLEDLKKHPENAEIPKIDSLFPNLESKFIIGTERVERNKKIEEIFGEINSDIKALTSNQLVDLYKNHYKIFISKLVEVRDHPLACLPKIKKNPIPVPCNDSNKNIEKGDFLFTLKSIKLPKPDRYFYIVLNFKYNDQAFTETFNWNDQSGNYNAHKNFKIDESKVLKKFSKESLTLSLYKRKFILSSRLVATANVPLDRLKNYCTVPLTVEFEYKEHKKLLVDIEFSINKALDTPLKDLYLFVIDKMVPPFSVAPKKAPNEEQKHDSKAEIKENKDHSTTDSRPKQTSTSSQHLPTEQKTSTTDPKNQPAQNKATFSSKYKFPVFRAAEKARLIATLAKNKIDDIYSNFQLSCFCVTFLEQFEGEIEKQIADLAEEGDSASRKEAEQMMMTASKYKSYLETNLGNGKMSQNDYKGKVEDFVKVDNQLLVFFEKNNLAQPAYYIKNRIEILEGEIKQLKEMGV